MNQKEEREMFDKAIKDFRGQMPTLEGAIGAYLVGKEVSWKVPNFGKSRGQRT